jgi:hypothetical protein
VGAGTVGVEMGPRRAWSSFFLRNKNLSREPGRRSLDFFADDVEILFLAVDGRGIRRRAGSMGLRQQIGSRRVHGP